MRQLIPDDIKARLAAFLDLSTVPVRVSTVSIPFGRFGTNNDVPVILGPESVRHGATGAPGAGEVITRRQQLDIGVYDVWWEIAILAVEVGTFTIAVENFDNTIIRFSAGFTNLGSSVGVSHGRLAILTVEQDDQIIIRTDAAIVGTVAFNSVIIQRLP